ncbi:hypothetical protein Glove_60g29 [Diversispora epigaea]|uniref:Uncharacterized protein n=1 Tax=Diversispora epigaea TaxID=1348612 RepID=A0A397JG16_9GLOM|nr:hypothetical protein Glove_60g29 [Diversispora epigaea]
MVKVLIAGKITLQLEKILQRSNKRKKIEENINVNTLKSEKEGISTDEYLTNNLQVEEEITLKISPPLNKVEVILNKYQEVLENSTDEGYIELDFVFINYNYQSLRLKKFTDVVLVGGLTCFQLSRYVLNDESSSEYQYRWIHHKNQMDLLKLPGDRRPIGWYHDGIITININGVDEYIGILEVVGNAIVENYEQIMHNNEIDNEKQLQQDLETFGILVDRRDFIIYAMHYYDGVYLVDETDLSFVISNTLMQLCLLKDIIKKLLAFRVSNTLKYVFNNRLLVMINYDFS